MWIKFDNVWHLDRLPQSPVVVLNHLGSVGFKSYKNGCAIAGLLIVLTKPPQAPFYFSSEQNNESEAEKSKTKPKRRALYLTAVTQTAEFC